MALRTLITERQRRLGTEVRKMRERAGLSILQAADLVGMGRPHISHIEAGRTAVPPERLRELAKAYGCTNEPLIAELVSMSESDGKGWWSHYRRQVPQIMLDLAELEARATHIRSHETLLIPGLLQTESYMRALFRSSRIGAPKYEIETAVRFRLDRQRILAPDSNVTLHAVIHEAALRIAVGGPAVMREQLVHLVRAAQRPGTRIQLLPFETGARAWFGTPFLIAEPSVPQLGTVILEHPAEPLRLDDDESLRRYTETFEGLQHSALPPVSSDGSPDPHEKRDSWGLIQHIAYTY
ncbi:helix-turn-helix transcriptional regulator [Streptomyces sp. NPDC003077]|uniref:helix-turn-helix domain-containing protein n=1 Tax=Streptomyces sp. NPDC003077 TaxID=3154443 RepID=UPI0033B00EF9